MLKRFFFKVLFTSFFVLVLSNINADNSNYSYKLLKAGKMLDVASGTIQENVSVLIENDKIKAINPSKIPKNTQVIDLSNQVILPGLIDMHVHLSMELDHGFKQRLVTEDPTLKTLRAARNAKTLLNAGFTTVRDLGVFMAGKDSYPANTAVSKAVDMGLLTGPRVISAGHFISMTGGHGDITGFAPNVRELNYKHGIADGVDEVMKAVRYQIKYGSKVIKFMATSGVITEEGGVGRAPQYSLAEMKAICDTAHRVGIKCAAHSESQAGDTLALKAGVDTLEHGLYLSDQDIQMMKAQGTVWVPTLLAFSHLAMYTPIEELPESVVERINKFNLKDASVINFKKALAANIKIAAGTDSGMCRHGENAKELALYVKYGMTPIQAIQTATINAAEAIGTTALNEEKIGQIIPGYQADIIAVKDNPLKSIETLENVTFVMKGGEIVK